MTRDEAPRDVWQLCERAVSMVPLMVAKMETLLGTPMVEDPLTPGRWEGAPQGWRAVLVGGILSHRDQGRRVAVRGD
jgi:hypothetical protein